MTTTESFANQNLSVDLDEDHMEMATSPYPPPHDNDIDFDLDDHREHSIEDNSMIDDTAEDLNTNITHDDMMYDEEENELLDIDQDLPMDPYESTYVNDEETEHAPEPIETHSSMPDQPFPEIKVGLVDSTQDATSHNITEDVQIDEFELQEEDTNVENTDATEDFERTKAAEDNKIDSGETVQQLPVDDQTSEEKLLQDTTAVVDFAEAAATDRAPEDYTEPSEHVVNQTDLESSVETTEPSTLEFGEESIAIFADELENSNRDQSADPQTDSNDKGKESPHREGTPENLHPVTVRYNGEDCWLFPPLETTDVRHVFLEDATLASQPFNQLLAAIRPGLINNQDMADHDEIVFNIPALGLYICEDSKHAPNVTLSKVIDMYMMLSQNEGLTDFEPLFCELSTRVCLADQFAYLEEAAFKRRLTYTDFVAEQAGTPEESAEADETTATMEEAQNDTTAYYDATIDQPNGEEASARLQEIEDTKSEHTGETVEDNATEVPEPEAETALTHETDEEVSADVQVAPSPTAITPNPASREPSTQAVAQSPDRQSPVAPADATRSPDRNGNAVADSSADVTAPALAEDDEDDDEDLFADDDDTTVEPEFEEAELDSANQGQMTDAIGVVDSNAAYHDDFDFDNWSDEEEKGDTATADVPKPAATPSKGANGKRKLIEEDDDFLEIDVSTPEPKRKRS